MKLKKGILLTALTLIAITAISVFSTVQAAEATTPKTLSIKALRKSGYGYQVVNNSTKFIWKIYDTDDDINETFYCIKGGPGFGSADMDGTRIKETDYKMYFDMKDPDSITSKYLSAIPDPDSKEYERLMWVLDQCYVQPQTNASSSDREKAEEYKQILLDAVEAYAEKYPGVYDNTSYINDKLTDNLTEDDIDAVQQLAVWYYTNSDDYHVAGNPSIKINSIRGTDGNYQSFDINDPEDAARIHAMDALYAYLIKTPQASGFSYDYENNSSSSKPAKIADTNITFETSDNRIIVGPYKIEELRDINYTLIGTFKDGKDNKITDIKYLDNNKNEIEDVTTIKDLVGSNFYISIPSNTDTSNINFTINGSFWTTEVTYWSVENPGDVDQPIVQIEKVNKTFSSYIEAQEEPDLKFDLALRKFITQINNEPLEREDSRVPSISDSELNSLANGNKDTAEKVHRKDALTVKTGDKVIYTIRVYNEGDIDGWATQVTDHLPEGLKFIPAEESEINREYGWQLTETIDMDTNKTIAYVTTDYLAGANHKLTAFNKDTLTLDHEDLQIECEVIATAGNTAKSLKNVAEITGNKDIKGNTNVDLDRDSQPNSLTEDQINDYGDTGNYYQDDDDFEHLILETEQPQLEFDLALRKFITKINNVELTETESRVPTISETELGNLANGSKDTAEKVHRKDALTVKTGDKVVYTIRVYNEGEVDGWATQITDHLPEGLKFIPAEQSTINTTYGWKNPLGDGKTIVTNYLASKEHKLTAYNKDALTIDYEDIKIECEVVATAGSTTKNLKNIAEITGNKDINGNTNVNIDRDSQPGSLTDEQIKNYGDEYGDNYQDDDDFEQLKILPKEEAEKEFDLALRKFISNITNSSNKQSVVASREPEVDVSPLLNGQTTAIYNHTKEPVGVSNGDIVTYTIRVYNEGEIDGYITEITDHLPSQLEFIVDDELNAKYGWVVSTDGRTVTTDITSPNTTHTASRDTIYADRNKGSDTDKVLLKAFDGKEGSTLDYIDVQIRCKVKENIDLYEKITNIADITGFTDSEGATVTDRDSQKDNVTLPSDETLPEYKDPEIERGDEYIPGQQDDDDFEKLVLQRFDLALRKFITGVVSGEKTTDITNRAPVFKKISDTQYTYEHTKEPVEVANGNTVIYTLRIFNEGNVAGYATKVKDDIPEGLEFLPENSVNTAFGWKMYEEDGTETKDVSKAKYIETDFLSKDKETEKGDNLIDAFNPQTMTMPDYKDLKIAFKVTEPNTSDRIIINQAQISEDSDKNGNPIDDVDSIPNEWNDGEDDQDIEKIKVKYFDLSLKKWVTESIVTVDGKTTTTKSGHTGDENPEPPMKVEIQTGKINKTTVKFKYSIKVTNEGEIEGYVKELVDYIPEGLKFVAKDNPKWTVNKDGKVVTDQLKDTLLQPGESATVDIVLTWINGKNNMGTKVNWAEISKDDNPYDSPDIDSTPGNNVKGEDDIDQAPVLLSPATGSVETYMTLTVSCIAVLAGGIFLIKKFVI